MILKVSSIMLIVFIISNCVGKPGLFTAFKQLLKTDVGTVECRIYDNDTKCDLSFFYFKDLGYDVRITLILKKYLTPNKLVPFAQLKNINFCAWIKTRNPFLIFLRTYYHNQFEQYDCPFHKGVRLAKNLTFDAEKYPKIFTNGKYRYQLDMIHNKSKFISYYMEFVVR